MDLVETLTQNLSGFSSETLIWINGIVSNATRAVGLYLVGILLVLELAKMFEKSQLVKRRNRDLENVSRSCFSDLSWGTCCCNV